MVEKRGVVTRERGRDGYRRKHEVVEKRRRREREREREREVVK